jgi:hypothetical protein
MSRDDLLEDRGMVEAVHELVNVGKWLLKKGGKFSSWVGTLTQDHVPSTVLNKGPAYEALPGWPWDEDIPWFTLWEYSWVLRHLKEWTDKPIHILSLGGNACLLDVTLLARGHTVTLIDRRGLSVQQQQVNARLMGATARLSAHVGAMEDVIPRLAMASVFTAMTSTNVLFLAGSAARQAVSEQMQELIVPAGRAFVTFDYLNPNPVRYLDDPLTYFSWPGFHPLPYSSNIPEANLEKGDLEKGIERARQPGPGASFFDNGERYHLYYPEPAKGLYTAGGLIQERDRF